MSTGPFPASALGPAGVFASSWATRLSSTTSAHGSTSVSGRSEIKRLPAFK
ncbi:MAG: hypothetical protein AAEJ52_15955 [Myxococcota bacterium]